MVAFAPAACGEHEGKLDPAAAAGAVTVEPRGGEGGAAAGGAPIDEPALPMGGAGGETPVSGGSGGGPRSSECIYQRDVAPPLGAGGESAGGASGVDVLGGAAGAGGQTAGGEGGAGPSPTVAKATSRALGDYLVDEAGRTLYVFGADLAGDCEAPPLSVCEGDCLLSWPIFHVAERVLGPGIDPAAFGSFARADGTLQTTYYGWPLYYYANDAKPGDITGHGSGVWGLAELILPNIVVRRLGMDRFLADGAGRTLYSFADDTRGTTSSDPVSACAGACLEAHPPFSPRYVGAISTLEARDFRAFLRADGITQVAYKGAPLYYSMLDERPGAVDGVEDEGFTIVLK
jgi:predicted lipoprotein with Yx(FWY)xxD motif